MSKTETAPVALTGLDLSNYPNVDAFGTAVKSYSSIAEAVENHDVQGWWEPSDDEFLAAHDALCLDYQVSGKQAQMGKTDKEVRKGQEFYLTRMIESITTPYQEFMDKLYKDAIFDEGSEEEIAHYANEAQASLASRNTARPEGK